MESSALHRYGIRLMPDEEVSSVFDKGRGFTEDVSRLREGFVLTSHRIIYAKRGAVRRQSRAALLEDTRYLELQHEGRSVGLLIFAVLAMVGAGAGATQAAEQTYLYAAAGLAGFGLLLLLAWWFGGSTEIRTQIGGEEIRIEVGRSLLEDAEDFVSEFFERKSNLSRVATASE